jgi:tetratricopeptide (TPR) repeat protein
MRPLKILTLIAFLTWALALPAQTRDENWKRCEASDWAAAIEACSAIIQSSQETSANKARALYVRGTARRRMGDSANALEDFSQALQLDTNNANIFRGRGRGRVYLLKGENDKAIEDFNQALRIDPAYSDGYVLRGNAYSAKGNYARAVEDFDQALQLNPTSADAFYNRAREFANNGQYERSIPDWNRAIQYKPGDADSYYGRGQAYSHTGDYQRAIQDYTETLRIDPKYASALYLRRRAHLHEGNYLAASADSLRSIGLKLGTSGTLVLLSILAALSIFSATFLFMLFRKRIRPIREA